MHSPFKIIKSKLETIVPLDLVPSYMKEILHPNKRVINLSWLYNGDHVYNNRFDKLTKALVYWNAIHAHFIHRFGDTRVVLEQHIFDNVEPILSYIMSTLHYGFKIDSDQSMVAFIDLCLGAIGDQK